MSNSLAQSIMYQKVVIPRQERKFIEVWVNFNNFPISLE